MSTMPVTREWAGFSRSEPIPSSHAVVPVSRKASKYGPEPLSNIKLRLFIDWTFLALTLLSPPERGSKLLLLL